MDLSIPSRERYCSITLNLLILNEIGISSRTVDYFDPSGYFYLLFTASSKENPTYTF